MRDVIIRVHVRASRLPISNSDRAVGLYDIPPRVTAPSLLHVAAAAAAAAS